jgi:DNA-binding Lrp family transcriptional regulator
MNSNGRVGSGSDTEHRSRDKKSARNKKQKLQSEAKILKALMTGQPLTKNEIKEKTKMGRTACHIHVSVLESEKVVKKVGGKYIIALAGFTDTLVTLDALLQDSLGKRSALARTSVKQVIALQDLANWIGKPPEAIEKDAYYLAKKHGFDIGPKTTPPLDALSVFDWLGGEEKEEKEKRNPKQNNTTDLF